MLPDSTKSEISHLVQTPLSCVMPDYSWQLVHAYGYAACYRKSPRNYFLALHGNEQRLQFTLNQFCPFICLNGYQIHSAHQRHYLQCYFIHRHVNDAGKTMAICQFISVTPCFTFISSNEIIFHLPFPSLTVPSAADSPLFFQSSTTPMKNFPSRGLKYMIST